MLTRALSPVLRAGHVASARFLSTGNYEYILAEKQGPVGVITLNRPKALNALCEGLIAEINTVTREFDADPEVASMVITGSERAFAAGADIKEMKDREFVDNYSKNMFVEWADLTKIQKPVIAAVNGYALGGGCELAMMCDVIVAGDNAKFGQPEITIGTIPGCGGTQRLIRAVGKSKAMELILTGDQMDADEAERRGLVARVVPKEETFDAAMSMANKMAKWSKPILMMCKEAVNAADQLPLDEGLRFERRLFHSTFATKDQKEGMNAFAEKRKPKYTDR